MECLLLRTRQDAVDARTGLSLDKYGAPFDAQQFIRSKLGHALRLAGSWSSGMQAFGSGDEEFADHGLLGLQGRFKVHPENKEEALLNALLKTDEE